MVIPTCRPVPHQHRNAAVLGRGQWPACRAASGRRRVDVNVQHLVDCVIQMLAPAFFTANGTGTGAAAATAVRVLPNGTQIPVPVITCSNGRCNTVPIDLSQGPVYLSLYGTGFRHRSANPNGVPLAGCQIQNQIPFASYAGPQGLLPGLDQLNLQLPQVSGAGETDVVCNFSLAIQVLFERAFSRPVKINLK